MQLIKRLQLFFFARTFASMKSKLENIIEAIIFVAEQPISLGFIQDVLQDGPQAQIEIDFEDEEGESQQIAQVEGEPISRELLEAILERLVKKYKSDEYAFEIKLVAGGYQFFSKKEFFPYVRRATLINQKKRLSRVVMETLAIVAYRQPITKAELEFIRGVNCDYAVQKLLEKNLVSIIGRSDAPGKPLLYATSPFFMQYFGLSDMTDLPKLKEFEELAEEHLEAFRIKQSEHTDIEKSNGESETEEGSLLAEESKQQKAETTEEETSGVQGESEEGNPEEEKGVQDPSEAE